MTSLIASADLQTFSEFLRKCDRIVALLGAGLSASSGLPTFRGAGGMWRAREATQLATPRAFEKSPDLVWQFYSYRRHMALNAKPNRAHYALAELARKNKNFITLSQNVDGKCSLVHSSNWNGQSAHRFTVVKGLSPRAGHPSEKLHLLHGSLFDVKCTSFYCSYSRKDDFTDPIVPALAIPTEGPQPLPSEADKTGAEATASLYGAMKAKELDISDPNVPLPSIPVEELPKCPQCGGLLRPGVVWFGEALPSRTMRAVEEWFDASPRIDLMLVIGTSAQVWPAAGYVEKARAKGARVAVVNMDRNDVPGGEHGLQPGDWFFQGDAGVIVPEILKSVIGESYETGQQ